MKKPFLFGLFSKPVAAATPSADIGADVPFGSTTYEAFLARLTLGNPLAMLGELTEGFAHLESPELVGDLRARLLLCLDDRGCDCVMAIERGLFAHVAAETPSEPRRLALLKYFERFGAAALATLAAVPLPGAPLGSSLSASPAVDSARILPLINRALLALYGRQKMLAMGHREIPASFWSEVLRLYRLAAAQGIADTPCMPYSKLPLTCSASQLTALLMAFNCAPREDLRPNEMQALDRLLRGWFDAHLLEVTTTPGTDKTVFFFGAGMRGPFRALPAMQQPGDGVLYVSLDEAHARVADLAERVREARALPPGLGTIGCPIDAWIHLLEALAAHWSPAPVARQSERRAHVGEMLVAQGFATAMRLIVLSAQARALTQTELTEYDTEGPATEIPGLAPGFFSAIRFDIVPSLGRPAPPINGPASVPGSQRGDTLRALQQLELKEKLPGIVKWQFLDHSATGFAVLITGAADWAHPGRVLTYRREHDPVWRMATIRRRTRNASGNLVIGLEKLPAAPQIARIKPFDGWGDWTALPIERNDSAPAIFFGSRPPVVLIERARFREGQRYVLVVGSERHLITLRVRKERDPDFVVARVEFMSAPVGSVLPIDQITTSEIFTMPDQPYLPPSSVN